MKGLLACQLQQLGLSSEVPPTPEQWTQLLATIHNEGHVIGRVWFFRDVTVRKRHEAELHRLSDERHQFLFKTSPLPIWNFDPMSHAITAVNDAMVRLLGFSREQLVAMTVSDLKPADDHAEVRAGVSHSPQGAVFRVGVKKYRRHAGTFVDLDITSPTIEMDGKRVMLAMGVDVTEARRLRARLRQAQQQDAIGQLAGGDAP